MLGGLGSFFPLFFCGSGKLNNKKLQTMENNTEWMNNFVNLTNLCLNMFEWEGLPETCNYRFLEQALFFEGKCGLAKDPTLGYLTLRCNPMNNFNIYGELTELQLYGFNGYNRRFKAYLMGGDNKDAESVLCRDNECSYPYYLYVMLGAERLSDAKRSIDIASFQLKTPYFITCDETQRTSVEKILTDIAVNKPAIISSKSISPDSFKVLQTGANPNALLSLWDNYYKHDNDIRTMLGIQNNPASDKAERLIVDEVNSNNQVTDLNIQMRLNARKLFCEQVNETFGLNVSVKLRNPIEKYNERSEDDVLRTEETPDDVQEMEGNL